MEITIQNLIKNTDVISWMPLLLTWIVFRYGIFNARKNLIANLEKEMIWMGQWLGTPYPGDFRKKDWYDPFRKVFDLENLPALQSAISSPYSNLLNNDLQKNLAALNIGINRFNQHVKLHQDFITANPELTTNAWYEIKKELGDNLISTQDLYCLIETKKQVTEIEIRKNALFLERVENLQAAIHHSGIGSNGEYGPNLPTTHKAYVSANESLREEKRLPWIKWWDVFGLFMVLLPFIHLIYCLELCVIALLVFALIKSW